MRIRKICYYLRKYNGLTLKKFYLKQRRKTAPSESETIHQADYAVTEDWRLIHRRQCAVQQIYVETPFELPEVETANKDNT